MLHAKCRIRFATLLLYKRQTFLGISVDGISLVSLFNQGPANVISFGELFSISNRLLTDLSSSLVLRQHVHNVLETISIEQDEQNNASTHFSPPSPLPYDPILAHKCETPAVRTYPSIPHTPAPFQRRSRVGFKCWVFMYTLLLPCSSSRVSFRFVVGSTTKYNTFC